MNGLNKYTAAGPASFTYDANANLIWDGSTSFLYDVENRMVGAGGLKNAALRYDPLGRLYEVAGPSATTRFLYDGDALVAEYDASGNLLRRYVHGADLQSHDPVAWYEGASFGGSNERFMRPDWQGSISLVTDNAGGQIIAANTYDEYGIPGSANAGRFQYTGQAWMPELGMYYYKARMYSPTLGRFMQTDPIGYKDNVNLYAYVQNDPVDGTDYTGNCGEDACVVEGAAAGATYVVLSGVVAAGYCVETCGSIVHGIEKLAGQIFHHNEAPPVPTGPVGTPPHTEGKGGQTQSGPLHPDHGGTGDAGKDHDHLTGGTGKPNETGGRPAGTRVGDNGIQIRPGKPGQGPRIDIPPNGTKPGETLHYPPPPPPPPPKLDGF